MKPPTPGEMASMYYIESTPHPLTNELKAYERGVQAERDRVRAAVPSWDSTLDIAEGDEPCCCGECRECGFNACRALWLESLGGDDE